MDPPTRIINAFDAAKQGWRTSYWISNDMGATMACVHPSVHSYTTHAETLFSMNDSDVVQKWLTSESKICRMRALIV